jgi:type II secretory pathway pseudopilin PulG
VKSPSTIRSRPARAGAGEQGYVLLTLLLLSTVLAISLAMILPDTVFEQKRDREEELVHRGVQYTRAIQAYYKKFGRYPTRLEDLESTNNLRFLRRRYKDPENKNQDFRLLHYGEVSMLGGGIGGGGITGAVPAGALNAPNGSLTGGATTTTSPFSQASSFSQQAPSFNQTVASVFGSNSNTPASSAGTTATTNSDGSQTTTDNTGAPGSAPGSNASGSPQQTFGGGPIIGVASTSKATSIREYNHKRKYSDWQFVYDPTADRGGLIRTPYQPLPAFASLNNQQPGQPGQSNQPGTPGSSPFSSNPFSSGSSSFNSNSNMNSNFSNPSQTPQPTNPPQQQ